MPGPCIRWENKLATTRVDQLSPLDREELRRHMQTCRACFTLYTDYLTIDDYVRRTLAKAQYPGSAFEPVLPGHRTRRPFSWMLQPGSRKPGWLAVAITICMVGLTMIGIILAPLSLHGSIPRSNVAHADRLALKRTIKKPLPGWATWVRAVAWSPKGKYIAVLWDNNTMQVFNAVTGDGIFIQDVGGGYGLAWSPNGQFLASVGQKDNTIDIWDMTKDRCATDTRQHCLVYQLPDPAQVEAIAWSPDGKAIASANDDGTVQVWGAHTMQPFYKHPDPGAKVMTIAWSPDGARLVSGDDNGHIQAWDAFTGMHVMIYPGHSGAITSINWSADGTFIASSSYDGTVRIWNAATGVARSFSPCTPVFAAVWAPGSNKYLALACYDGSVQIWSAASLERITMYPEPENDRGRNGIFTISWSPQGNQLIAGGLGNIFDVRLGN